MALLMVLDHIPHIEGLVPPMWASIFHGLTRCVGVFFAFMAVEGFVHTRNRWRYNFRLFGWALFMELGNRLLQNLLNNPAISNNIFLTLAIGVFILNITQAPFDFLKSHTKLKNVFRMIISILIMLPSFLFCEGAHVILHFMLITWFCREKTKQRNIIYVVMAILLLIPSVSGMGMYQDIQLEITMFLYNADWLFITVLPFLYLYNGERGPRTSFAKYFFYFFYPAHLWLIALINAYMIG